VGQADVSDMETLVDKCSAMLTSTRQDLEAAKANCAQARKDLDECTIRSPMDGVVSKLTAEEGENVVIGTMNNAGTVIMTISDMSSIIVRARIDETYVPLVQPGQSAKIYLQCDGETVLTGKVKRVSPKGEKGVRKGSSGTQNAQSADPNELAKFETLITIDQPPPKIRLGMTANVEIVVEERKDVLSIPPHAVLQRRAKDLPSELTSKYVQQAAKRKGFEDPNKRWFQVVFVEQDGAARCKVVHTGVSDESRVEVTANPNEPDSLREGERVIVGPFRAFDKLRDGRAVKEFVEGEAKAGS
jgi:HlyD family secretion protein